MNRNLTIQALGITIAGSGLTGLTLALLIAKKVVEIAKLLAVN